MHRENREEKTAVEILPPFCLFDRSGDAAKLLEGVDRRYAPLNDWLQALLQPRFRNLMPSESRFNYTFDKLEILMALGYAYHAKRAKDWYWAPPGSYGYRHDSRERILTEIRGSLDDLGDKSPYVRSNIFGRTTAECNASLEAFANWVKELRWW